MDEISVLDFAEKRGYEKGKEMWKRLGEVEVIKNMLKVGLDVSVLEKATSLTSRRS
ncbi:hypothetical protein [Shimazuella alba]|uniref:Uncharacterized protein n=1 Tax=Shimazuella alba TaxID=2690964 RepID=A0A6I4VU44_9BACL|nr:hypothetical protein [Shimazuella alba]MXQ54031.1 hypothetical protein [Shimazuella alba]